MGSSSSTAAAVAAAASEAAISYTYEGYRVTPVEGGAAASGMPPATRTAVNSAVWKDACEYLAAAAPAGNGVGTTPALNSSECATWSGGVLRQGLMAGLQEWQRVMRQALDRHNRVVYARGSQGWRQAVQVPVAAFNYSTVTCQPASGCRPNHYRELLALTAGAIMAPTITPPTTFPNDTALQAALLPGGTPQAYDPTTEQVDAMPWGWLRAADEHYLVPGLEALQVTYVGAVVAAAATLSTFITAFLLLVAAAFLAYMFFVFLPLIPRTNRDIYARRCMLLYVPADLVTSTPAFAALLQTIISSSASGDAVAMAGTNTRDLLATLERRGSVTRVSRKLRASAASPTGAATPSAVPGAAPERRRVGSVSVAGSGLSPSPRPFTPVPGGEGSAAPRTAAAAAIVEGLITPPPRARARSVAQAAGV